jgi:zinc and cadmium transporter
MVLIYSLLAITLISLFSLIGGLFLLLQKKSLKTITPILISLAIGTLLGDAFIHLIPEAITNLSHFDFSFFLVLGFFLFFIFEKTLCWHHCQNPDADHADRHPLVVVNLLTDGLHNFIDGMLIASSFAVNPSLGLATSLAVLFHEIPQEVGDFGILIHQGLSPTRALILNLLSSLSAFIGLFIVLYFGQTSPLFINSLLSFTAGGFIYLAASDLIPQLHSHSKISDLVQFFFIALGLLFMFLLS